MSARHAVLAAALAAGALLAGCATPEPVPDPIVPGGIRQGRELVTLGGGVACVDGLAARVGAEILAQGGNAVDAAIATGLALAVTHPAAGNLGGGGFMLVRTADGEEAAFDYREVAPAALGADLFLDEEGEYRPEWRHTHRAVGVPGTVAGFARAHARFGSLPWARLVLPAERLAREGLVVDQDLHDSLRAAADRLSRNAAAAALFLDDQGQPPPVGVLFVQRDLARTLRRLAKNGPDEFYRGETAGLIVADMEAQGGVMTAEDLARYRAVERLPLELDVFGHRVLAMPPPSSSGVALGQILGILERRGIAAVEPMSLGFAHLYAEAARRAFADRAAFLGDDDFVDVPVAELLADARLDALAASIEDWRATPSEELGPPVSLPEGEDTTHYSVVDRWGNVVSNTYTLEQSYGAGVVAAGTGILLNNELGDFNRIPGLTDTRGFIGTAPNLAAPGKRPLSSMSPVIVLKGEAPVFVAGSPGGRTIINTVGGLLVDVLAHGADPADALARPRLHHGWFPDRLQVEDSPQTAYWPGLLGALGHEVRLVERQGDAHVIALDPRTGERRLLADTRIDGGVAVADPPAAERAPPRRR